MQSNLSENFALDLNLIEGFDHYYRIDKNDVQKIVKIGDQIFVRSLPKGSFNKSKNASAAWWRSFLDNEDQFNFPHTQDSTENQTISYVDLFSSVGGLSLGLDEAIRSIGFQPKPLVAVDIDEGALRVHRHNHETERLINESVANLVDYKIEIADGNAQFSYPPEILDVKLRDQISNVDVILAGPPCQGHSTLNNYSRGNDPRNELYLTVPAIAIASGAKAVIIENVPNVINDFGNVVEITKQLLTSAGYQITTALLQAHKLGWAQTRKRYFIVATLGYSPINLETLSTVLEEKATSVEWAIDKLSVTYEDSKHVMNSVADTKKINQDRIDWLFENNAYELPNDIRPDCHKDGHTYPPVYGRMKWNEPAPTLTTGFSSPGRGRFIHPKERRVLTPREAARLQGFPNWFNFSVSTKSPAKKVQLTKWIGDAVPSILGYVVGISALAFKNR